MFKNPSQEKRVLGKCSSRTKISFCNNPVEMREVETIVCAFGLIKRIHSCDFYSVYYV